MKQLLICLLICSVLPLSSAYSQKGPRKIMVTGTVIDSTGNPVKGTLFFLDGKKISATSKSDGSFKFKATIQTRKIAAFSVNYGGIEIPYNGETKIEFRFSGAYSESFVPEPEVAGEVVNIGYTTARRQDLTTSVGSVNKKNLATRNYSNIYEMIAGEVPGVMVNGRNITIRGASSINASSQPMFVVDGSPATSIDYINPVDVKSIDVLKGAAAAIYGNKGTNGVIIIKLK